MPLNHFSLPFLLRLDDAMDRVFPPVIVKLIYASSVARGRRGEPLVKRGIDPKRTLRRLSRLRSDSGLVNFLWHDSSVREVKQIWFAAVSVQNMISRTGGEGLTYDGMRKRLGKNPQVLELARMGLEMMF